jgi:hypothetical protein
MPTSKLGQSSSNQVSDLNQMHFDVDMKIRDTLTTAPLNVKRKLASRLPQIIDEMKSEPLEGEPSGSVNP